MKFLSTHYMISLFLSILICSVPAYAIENSMNINEIENSSAQPSLAYSTSVLEYGTMPKNEPLNFTPDQHKTERPLFKKWVFWIGVLLLTIDIILYGSIWYKYQYNLKGDYSDYQEKCTKMVNSLQLEANDVYMQETTYLESITGNKLAPHFGQATQFLDGDVIKTFNLETRIDDNGFSYILPNGDIYDHQTLIRLEAIRTLKAAENLKEPTFKDVQKYLVNNPLTQSQYTALLQNNPFQSSSLMKSLDTSQEYQSYPLKAIV